MLLQKAPLGLLGALELKVLGKNPDQLADALVATYDAEDFYGLPNAQILTATGNLTSTGDLLQITVPSNQVYRVHTLAMRISINAGDKVGGILGVQVNANSTIAAIHADNGSIIGIAAAFSGNWACATRLERPLLLGPGSILTWYQGTAVGAARAASLTAYVEVFST